MERPIYRECMRNHAAKMGSYATDGCREYTPSASGTDLCAACGCHRSYHRRIDLEPSAGVKTHFRLPHMSLRRVKQMARQRGQSLAAAAAAATDEEDEEEEEEEEEGEEKAEIQRQKQRRKSKFTAEQREAMREYAEKLGWTLRDKRGLREEISLFCEAIGVSRYLFKTWVNNNKRFYSVS